MGDTPGSNDVSPLTRTPRDRSPTPASATTDRPKDSSRVFSPLRKGETVSSNGSATLAPNTAPNGTPIITKSAPTGEPTSDNEGSEFPFHAISSQPDSNQAKETKDGEGTSKFPPRSVGPNGSIGANPPKPISRRPTAEGDESDAPKGRRSVQFARSATFDSNPATHSRHQSWDTDEEGGKGKEKERQGSSLITKLRGAFATPMQGHGRTQSAFAGSSNTIPEGSPHGQMSPASERGDFRFDGQDSEADADAEESAGEGPSRPARRRRKSRRWFDDGTQTAPTTPKMGGTNGTHFFSRDSPGGTPTSTTANRPSFLRRGTMSDIPENQRQGVSEDEGRDRLAKESAWTRGLHSARGLSYGGLRRHDHNGEDSEDRRPSQLRRLTGFGGTGGEGQPSPWRMRSERTSSLSAQKWRSIKNSLKMIGASKRAERQVDHAKSAELMAELLSGAPAALFLASMFQRDEHGRKRIPILLEQLKVSVTDSYPGGEDRKIGERHTVLRIELEYGSGLTRMKWIIHRSLRDFANLHLKYKVQQQQEKFSLSGGSKKKNQKVDDDKEKVDKGPKLPSFPFRAMPYLRGLRGYEDLVEKDGNEDVVQTPGGMSGPEGDASGLDRPGPSNVKRRKSSFQLGRRTSSMAGNEEGTATRQGSFVGGVGGQATKQNQYEQQRKLLERYLNQLITFLIFRPDSNRLCKFLELSALGVRLAAEGGYHGKEGYMMIRSAKGVDNRKKWGGNPMVQRHWPKWFLVRHSYVVCVDSPEEMNVYDVFLVDSDFSIEAKGGALSKISAGTKDAVTDTKAAAASGHHQLRLFNSERKMKLIAKNERQAAQFMDSIKFMVGNTQWAKPQRFGSFAPVRKRIYAQWLVDGRDYMWNVSRAISMAKDVIYIHDWWLSPELYMRRPAAISQKWRLDRLLQRKAQEGVKVFVIMYRNINTAIPIDSEYSKYSLLDLHPNVFVQRSPNQIRQNTFFWAHHEKICIVDHTIAFCGGVDLCFGRWDTPQHAVVDDKLTGFELDDTPKDADHCQLWPGKDYSNPRVQDFYSLDKPYEEMYDRSKVPRMPWHDIGMQIVGQPARDLTRHFVQRWNYLLRQRKPSRPTPFLLPPPDFNPADIEALGLDGTCEVQILRSATSWSLGTPNKTEHSIMNAYVQMISTSEHFVYIENQFYISSCEVLGTKIENRISDALVDRIKRAHKDSEDWRACIVIPLMPGFQNTVDQQDGSSVRLIMTCQYRSICRGPTSIFGRLRAAGIEPEDYIQFYALRSWGALGPTKTLVTEQLYIHAKCMIVDDRVAIIGSANINERSMLGSRDSEVAAVVRDTEMLDSYMAGEPYKVGKFPHTLRVRLMREHLGVDVDHIHEDEWPSQADDDESALFHTDSSSPSSPNPDRATEEKLTANQHRLQDDLIARSERLHSFNHDIDWEQDSNPHLQSSKKPTTDSRITNNAAHEKDVRGEGVDNMRDLQSRPSISRGRDSYVNDKGQEVLMSDVAVEGHHHNHKRSPPKKTRPRSNTAGTRASGASSLPEGYAGLPPPRLPRMDTRQLGLTQLSQLPALPVSDDTDIGGPPLQRTFSYASSHVINPLLQDMRRPIVTDDCMRDPLNDSFYLDTWHAVAENNTKLFRQVFRCQPDNEVKTWKEYKEYTAFAERFSQSQGGGKSTQRKQQETPGKTGPPGSGGTTSEKVASAAGSASRHIEAVGEKLSERLSHDHPSTGHSDQTNDKMGNVEQWAQDQEKHAPSGKLHLSPPAEFDEKSALKRSLDDAVVSPIGPPVPEKAFTFPPPPPIPSDPSVSTTATADFANANGGVARARTVTISEPTRESRAHANTISTHASQRRRRRATTKSSTRAFNHTDEAMLLDKEDAKQLLELVQGHLVVWPYEWLEKEESGGGWLYTVDQIAPLEIYT
ncbi:phospholipase D [Aaosphaeria arxii CBS 175.79]|uniref:Phospholipase D1 n=1 Tax=Aaosphaeria arxii CBS 175.79 TaxID=1450172 RepID=A0A6A5Y624_9PLEO|nr:phospholipase D [Aaosphaeria arxii CBS 175.79]KAF2020230.1 phospholipase D [Aaosphaeria arxii CBS 175.79]